MRATNDFLRTNSEKAVFVMVDDVRDAISSGELTANGRDLVYVLGKENFKIGVLGG